MMVFTKSRNSLNAERPGSYQIATQGTNPNLNPGETLNFSQFITGYGEISSAKIQSYISAEIFENDSSRVRYGMLTEKKGALNAFKDWGANTYQLDSKGFAAFIPPNNFLDSDPTQGETRIITELSGEHAPFEYTLKLKKNAPPGNYHIDFYLTYFNGSDWKTNKERVDFKVNNKFEQYGTALSVAAAIAIIVTILHDGLWPILDTAHTIGKYISSLHR